MSWLSFSQVIPPPTLVQKGCFPADDSEAWQNNVVLVDKPLEWTSFGICGKLRGALDINKVRKSEARYLILYDT